MRVDLVEIMGVVRRHLVVTALVVVATLLGAGTLVAVSPPTYTATSSYLLIEPPSPPTAEALADNPRLGRINSDNPFVRYGDPAVIIDVVSRIAATDAVRDDVADSGGTSDFEAVPSARYGAASPIIDVTVTGSSQERVLSSLALVGDYVGTLLRRVQRDEGVDERYFFTLRQINAPREATLELSSTLRLLVVLLALGGLTLVVVLSTLEGRRRRRPGRFEAPHDGGRGDLDDGARHPDVQDDHGSGPAPEGDDDGPGGSQRASWLEPSTARGGARPSGRVTD